MLKKIKGTYFLKVLFYHVSEGKKLDINIEDYKKIRWIYKEGEINGKGKEFNILTNNMIFEGEYLNRKRNGKGKEYNYDTGFLEFEGEYLNGKRHGKGKDYDGDDLLFEGEYLNGQRNGKGKEYFLYGDLQFEGEYLNGKKWTGKGYGENKNIEYEINNGKGNIKEYYNCNRS